MERERKGKKDGRTQGTGIMTLSPRSQSAMTVLKNAWLHPEVIATSSHVGGPSPCVGAGTDETVPSSPIASTPAAPPSSPDA